MPFDFLGFVSQYKWIILFYLAVVILLVIYRKRLEFQAKIIILLRTKIGLSFMDFCARKFREWIILLGYVGTGVGFIGMGLIAFLLIKNLYDVFTNPQAISGVSLVIPGVKVPGLGILPFWYWLVAIFIIAVVHEWAHGIVARAHNIEVKNTGIVFLGPILGAFVEPDEKKMKKEKDIVQYSVLAAGSFSNILLAILAVLLLNFAFMPLHQSMVEPLGFSFASYAKEDGPAAIAKLIPNTVITGLNGKNTASFEEFSSELTNLKPGEKITVQTKDKEYPLTLAQSPQDSRRAYLGIQEIKNEFTIKEKYQQGLLYGIYHVLDWFTGFLRWLFLLSSGIGLFNLLPLPIVDGGRMLQTFLHRLKGDEHGEKRYRQISLLILLILLLNLFAPLLTKVIF